MLWLLFSLFEHESSLRKCCCGTPTRLSTVKGCLQAAAGAWRTGRVNGDAGGRLAHPQKLNLVDRPPRSVLSRIDFSRVCGVLHRRLGAGEKFEALLPQLDRSHRRSRGM